MDLGDELRAALIVGSKCWGFMCLHRERSSPNFTPAEAAFLAKLTPHLAQGLRISLSCDLRTLIPIRFVLKIMQGKGHVTTKGQEQDYLSHARVIRTTFALPLVFGR